MLDRATRRKMTAQVMETVASEFEGACWLDLKGSEADAVRSALVGSGVKDFYIEAFEKTLLASLCADLNGECRLWIIPPRKRDKEVAQRLGCDVEETWSIQRCQDLAERLSQDLKGVCECQIGYCLQPPAQGAMVQFARNGDGPQGVTQMEDRFWKAAQEREGSVAVSLYQWIPGGYVANLAVAAINVGGLEGGSNPTGWMPRKVVQLSESSAVIVEGGPTESTLLVDMTPAGRGWSKRVSLFDAAVYRFCLVPSRYRDWEIDYQRATLGELTSHIGRGTSCRAKSLETIGPASVAATHGPVGDELVQWQKVQGEALTEGATPEEAERAADLSLARFVDSGCFGAGDDIKTVPLASLPEGQSRYVIMPEDGGVLLASRPDGRCCAYRAKYPTLVSNNVFILRLAEGAPVAEYLSCWMVGDYARVRLGATPSTPLSKGALDALMVPVLPPEDAQAIVARRKAVQDSLAALYEQAAVLESLNAFDLQE